MTQAICNLEVSSAARLAVSVERHEEFHAFMYRSLLDGFYAALRLDPATKVYTPGFKSTETPLFDVVLDSFSADSGDESLKQLLKIVSDCARGINPQQEAMRWIELRAHEYAGYHEVDAVLAAEDSHED